MILSSCAKTVTSTMDCEIKLLVQLDKKTYVDA